MNLVGELVALRAHREEDAERYAEILAEAETVRHLAQWSRPPAGVAQEREFIRAETRMAVYCDNPAYAPAGVSRTTAKRRQSNLLG
jgi:hypothetical protein